MVFEFLQTIFKKLYCKVIILIPFIDIDLRWSLTPRILESFTAMFFSLITRGKILSTTKGCLWLTRNWKKWGTQPGLTRRTCGVVLMKKWHKELNVLRAWLSLLHVHTIKRLTARMQEITEKKNYCMHQKRKQEQKWFLLLWKNVCLTIHGTGWSVLTYVRKCMSTWVEIWRITFIWLSKWSFWKENSISKEFTQVKVCSVLISFFNIMTAKTTVLSLQNISLNTLKWKNCFHFVYFTLFPNL